MAGPIDASGRPKIYGDTSKTVMVNCVASDSESIGGGPIGDDPPEIIDDISRRAHDADGGHGGRIPIDDDNVSVTIPASSPQGDVNTPSGHQDCIQSNQDSNPVRQVTDQIKAGCFECPPNVARRLPSSDCSAGGTDPRTGISATECKWVWGDTGTTQDPDRPDVIFTHSWIYMLDVNPCQDGCKCDESHWEGGRRSYMGPQVGEPGYISGAFDTVYSPCVSTGGGAVGGVSAGDSDGEGGTYAEGDCVLKEGGGYFDQQAYAATALTEAANFRAMKNDQAKILSTGRSYPEQKYPAHDSAGHGIENSLYNRQAFRSKGGYLQGYAVDNIAVVSNVDDKNKYDITISYRNRNDEPSRDPVVQQAAWNGALANINNAIDPGGQHHSACAKKECTYEFIEWVDESNPCTFNPNKHGSYKLKGAACGGPAGGCECVHKDREISGWLCIHQKVPTTRSTDGKHMYIPCVPGDTTPPNMAAYGAKTDQYPCDKLGCVYEFINRTESYKLQSGCGRGDCECDPNNKVVQWVKNGVTKEWIGDLADAACVSKSSQQSSVVPIEGSGGPVGSEGWSRFGNEPIKKSGPDGWAIAAGPSPTSSTTWKPPAFKDVVPAGLPVKAPDTDGTHHTSENTSFYKSSDTGQIVIDENGNVVRMSESSYKGRIAYGKMGAAARSFSVGAEALLAQHFFASEHEAEVDALTIGLSGSHSRVIEDTTIWLPGSKKDFIQWFRDMTPNREGFGSDGSSISPTSSTSTTSGSDGTGGSTGTSSTDSSSSSSGY